MPIIIINKKQHKYNRKLVYVIRYHKNTISGLKLTKLPPTLPKTSLYAVEWSNFVYIIIIYQ